MADLSKLQKPALLLFAVGGVIHIAFGFVYLTAAEFMPYHSQALSTDWADLDRNFQTLLLALIKICGAGGLVAGIVNLAFVVYFYRRRMSALIWILPITALIFQIAMNYSVYMVETNTPGHPPLIMVSIGTVAFIVATCLLAAGFRSGNA
jgi:peptidoglycan/LPS O-acetylase OafA/YrhL